MPCAIEQILNYNQTYHHRRHLQLQRKSRIIVICCGKMCPVIVGSFGLFITLFSLFVSLFKASLLASDTHPNPNKQQPVTR